jgi:hypothetical protein
MVLAMVCVLIVLLEEEQMLNLISGNKMHRIIIIIIFLICILQVPAKLAAIGPENDSLSFNTAILKEQLYMFTDRSLYASGEPVMFRVFNMSHTLLKNNSWSRVIYVELINSRNIPVNQGKYMLDSKGASGRIMMPDTLTTGCYYIRAYTKWMRNFSPQSYAHVPLTIVNPYKTGTSIHQTYTAKPGDPGYGTGVNQGITCKPDKSSYGKREKVTIEITGGSNNLSPDGYCIAVIKDGYLDADYSYKTDFRENNPAVTEDILYYPETKGLSISGYAVSGQDKKALIDSRLYLTLLGTEPDCFEFETDENGKIHFSIPNHTGCRDVLITAESEKDEEIRIILDDEFSREYSSFPESNVDFFIDRQDLVKEIMVYNQIERSFVSAIKDTLPVAESKAAQHFYGNPDARYRTDDYVMLPNLEEFFFELIPDVMLHKNKNEKYFTVFGEYANIAFNPPLVLLDYVPVLNIENILSVSPTRIDYIDIINNVYVRGENQYGGIINLVSRDGDRAGVKLPSSSSFFNFSTFNEPVNPTFPEYSKQLNDDNIPDLRTTLYWIPQIDIDTAEGKSIEFYTSDISGKYVIIIRGVTEDGKMVRGIGEFIVR